ncbi:MAG: OmpA family protein [Chitinophagales bacterium]|nr:OmpA family protein [Chitinophagales bacterium]
MKFNNFIKVAISGLFILVSVNYSSGQGFGLDSLDLTKSKKRKDEKQNQVEFLQPDIDALYYNYYKRDAISSPLSPRLDLDSMAFHKDKNKRIQQDAYTNNEYYYPSKPRNQWELGVNGGLMMISGDVKTKFLGGNKPALPGYGVGFSVRKALGYVLSIRGQYLFARTSGQNWEPRSARWDNAVNGLNDAAVDYKVNGNPAASGLYFPNYRTTLHEFSVSGVITLGNVRFHRERNRLNFYGFFGAGMMAYYTEVDQLDANGNIYDYRNVLDYYYTNQGLVNSTKELKAEVLNQLHALSDGKFETAAEGHKNEEGFGRYVTNPIANVGIGIGFHLSKKVTLNLEQRVTWTNDDLLDGVRWQDTEADAILTRDYDTYGYTFASLNFHLGKDAVEPLWWMNPMDHTYKRLGQMDPAAMIEDLIKDDDDDGVPNKLDREPETPTGCPIDPKGIALDSDGDGCIDCLDKEPFSPPGYPIDENCVAIVPESECCDEVSTAPADLDCSAVNLPSIHFEIDKFYISPEFFAHLHSIAMRMQMCPDLRVMAIGTADSRSSSKYNEQLSWNRVNKAITYLTEKYGLSRDRFIVDYIGEKEAGYAKSEFEHLQNRRVDFKFAEGESGPSNPPAPHPGLKAGSDNY